MKPKFTLLTHDYPPQKGGVARYLSSLVNAAEGNIEVIVPSGHLGGIASDKIHEARFWSSLWPHWLPLIKRCLEIEDEKIIVVSHVFPMGTAAWISNALGGPEYAVIFHGTDLKRVKNKWKRWLLRRICHNAKLLIVNSEATKKLLLRLVPSAATIKITPGLEPFSPPQKSAARQAFGINSGSKVILAVSRLIERKGLDTLIQSIANLSEEMPNIELVIVGSGPYAGTLRQLAELSGVNPRWVEDADDQTLYSWYAAADIFCLPGRETIDDIEGFGMVFLEAAYAGLPVIAGEGGGAAEAIENNKTGLLISPTVEACTQALRKLLQDPALSKQLGVDGHKRVVTDFNWEDRWNQLQNLDLGTQNSDSDNQKSSADISVVIPCYNHAAELKGTLESLANQTIKAKEVIVVDDGSKDNPANIISQFQERMPLNFIRLDNNCGAPHARNIGASKTRGEFIIFLDADANLRRDALEVLYGALVNTPGASYAYSDFIWNKRLFRSREFNLEALRKQNYIHTAAMIRKKDIVRFDESLKKFQDWDLWLTMAEQGKTGVWVPETLFTTTERKSGISQWLPAFMYKIPWSILGFTPKLITKYREAEKIIRAKHHI